MDFQCPIAKYGDYKKPRSHDNQDPDSEEQCTWTGPLQQLRDHCTAHHTVFQADIEIIPEIFRGVTICIPVICFDELFLFKQHYLKLRDAVYWSLQFVGDPDQASRYVFIVSIRSPRVDTPIQYNKLCRSIFIKDEDLKNSGFGLPLRANVIVPDAYTADFQYVLHVEILRVKEERTTFDLRSRNL